jgi:hypothetical protein
MVRNAWSETHGQERQDFPIRFENGAAFHFRAEARAEAFELSGLLHV